MNMKVFGVSHVGIGVRDMNKSIAFYRDVVGLRVAYERKYIESKENLARPEEQERRVAYLAWNDDADPCLVLSCHSHVSSNTPPRLDDLGLHHIALWVDDLKPVHARLMEAGVTITVPPTKFDQARGPVSTMFFEDPDGTLIQLDEIAK
jgi:catechol 2,3-dioxygenase-like lactoylglutathione lyase family enzyme